MPETMKEVTFSGMKSEGKGFDIRANLRFMKDQILIEGIPCQILIPVQADGKTGIWYIDAHVKKGNAVLTDYSKREIPVIKKEPKTKESKEPKPKEGGG